MKKFVSEYGDILLETMAVLAAFFIILFFPASNGGHGIGAVAAENMQSTEEDYQNNADRQAMINILSKSKPTIKYYPYDAAGQHIVLTRNMQSDLSSVVQCQDCDGNVLSDIEVLQITDSAGNELLSDKLADAKFTFASSGAYTITYKVTDGNNQVTKKKLKIPVSK